MRSAHPLSSTRDRHIWNGAQGDASFHRLCEGQNNNAVIFSIAREAGKTYLGSATVSRSCSCSSLAVSGSSVKTRPRLNCVRFARCIAGNSPQDGGRGHLDDLKLRRARFARGTNPVWFPSTRRFPRNRPAPSRTPKLLGAGMVVRGVLPRLSTLREGTSWGDRPSHCNLCHPAGSCQIPFDPRIWGATG